MKKKIHNHKRERMSFDKMVFLGTAFIDVLDMRGMVIQGSSCEHSYNVAALYEKRFPVVLFNSAKKEDCVEFIRLAVDVLRQPKSDDATLAMAKFVDENAKLRGSENGSSRVSASACFEELSKLVGSSKDETDSKKETTTE